MAKTKTLILTGEVVRADRKSRPSFEQSRYTPNSEYIDHYLDVELRLEDGTSAYFKTTPVVQVVTCAGPVAVATFREYGAGWDWFKDNKGCAVGTGCFYDGPKQTITRDLIPTLNVGDIIMVRATLKDERVSRAGRPYKVLNRVRRN